MLASDLNNTNFVNPVNPDSLLAVKFYNKSVQNNHKTRKEGRPIFDEVTYIEIMTPGNQLNIIDTPVREDHKQRFPIQWAAFVNTNTPDVHVSGTPLTEWPLISRTRADELKAMKFFTVEQIAGASDMLIQRIGMDGPSLKQKASAFIEAAKDSALVQRQAEELANRDAEIKEMKGNTEALQAQVESLMAKMEIAKEPRVKRKYTRRVKEPQEAS